MGGVLRVVRQDYGGIWLPGVRGPVPGELAHRGWSVGQYMDVRRERWHHRDPSDRIVSMASRRLRSRAQLTAWLAVIVALFVFVAVSQVDDDAAASLRTTDFVSTVQLDQTLAARQAQLVPQAWLEYGSLVVAGVAIGIALLVQR